MKRIDGIYRKRRKPSLPKVIERAIDLGEAIERANRMPVPYVVLPPQYGETPQPPCICLKGDDRNKPWFGVCPRHSQVWM